MHKILNWTLGGFFRTIGRTIAFLAIGALIAYIALKLDVKLPRGLAWSVVNAEQYTWLDLSSNTDYNGKLYFTLQSNSSYNVNPGTLQTLSDTAKLKTLTNTLCTANKTCTMSANKVYEIVWLLGDGTHDTFPAWLNLANNWEITPSQLFNNIKFDLRYYNEGTPTSFTTIYQLSDNTDLLSTYFDDFRFEIYAYDTNTAPQYSITLRFVPKYDLRDFRMTLSMTSGNVYNQIKNFYYEITGFRYSEGDYIPPVNDIFTDLANTIGGLVTEVTDELVELADDSVEVSWFNTYELETDSILTAIFQLPLNLIESIELEQYYPLCATLKGQQVCLPSGDIIWGRGTGVSFRNTWFGVANYQAFKEFFNLFVGGYLIWISLKSLFKTLEKVINPTKNSTEVIDL